jgi:hypothetical protein
MTDVSIVTQKARAARFVSSFESAPGLAGFENTRRDPPLLTDRQQRLVEQFAVLIPKVHRAVYRAAVYSRISGHPGDAACKTACIQASKGLVELSVLRAAGLITIDANGGAKLPITDQYRIPGGSKEVNGLVRKYRRIVK